MIILNLMQVRKVKVAAPPFYTAPSGDKTTQIAQRISALMQRMNGEA